MPHLQAWLEYWDRQIYNLMTGQPHVPLTIEAFRAICTIDDHEGMAVGLTR